jgi:hypothetical protein
VRDNVPRLHFAAHEKLPAELSVSGPVGREKFGKEGPTVRVGG